MRVQNEVAHVLDMSWDRVEEMGLSSWQIRTLRAIRECRTITLGGHVDGCDQCGYLKISYNSCRNRHCPKCQGNKRMAWIEAREADLLPVPYFHVVFTLPVELNPMALHKPRAVYNALFKAVWGTVQSFTGKAKMAGMISILHTWGQNMSLHPHLHCIIPAGVVTDKGQWCLSKSKGKFLYPVKAMSRVYRAKYLAELRKTERIPYTLSKALFSKEWVVYAKRPFGSPKSVIEYLGRYTHKVAITNQRIAAIGRDTVTIQYKDYRCGGKKKIMQMTHQEFIRRFTMHILPKRFVRIRHYGYLSSTWKRIKLSQLQTKLKSTNPQVKVNEKEKSSLPICPCCKKGRMIILLAFDKRGPPASINMSGSLKPISPTA